jgi:hypothetical protein
MVLWVLLDTLKILVDHNDYVILRFIRATNVASREEEGEK